MAVESLIIRGNPVLAWEDFRCSATRLPFSEYRFSDYRPDEAAEGGELGCVFRLWAPEVLLKEMFQWGLMREVETWDDELGSDTEGYINEMVFNVPPNQYTVTLDGMGNKMWMRADYDADGEAERTTIYQDTDSQEHFGIIERILSGGEAPSLNVADQVVQTWLKLRAWPIYESNLGAGRGDPHLEIAVRGYFSTLGFRTYNQTALSGNVFASTVVEDILDAVGQFVGSKEIGTNPTSTAQKQDADRRAQDIIQDIGRTGDSFHQRWLPGMRGRTIAQAVGRVAYFEPMAKVTV